MYGDELQRTISGAQKEHLLRFAEEAELKTISGYSQPYSNKALQGWNNHTKDQLISYSSVQNKRTPFRRLTKTDGNKKLQLKTMCKQNFKNSSTQHQNPESFLKTIDPVSSKKHNFSSSMHKSSVIGIDNEGCIVGKRFSEFQNKMRSRRLTYPKVLQNNSFHQEINVKENSRRKKVQKFKLRSCQNVGISNYPVDLDICLLETQKKTDSKMNIYLLTRFNSKKLQ